MQHEDTPEQLLEMRRLAHLEIREQLTKAWEMRHPGGTIKDHPEFEEFMGAVCDVAVAASLEACRHAMARVLSGCAAVYDPNILYPGAAVRQHLASVAQTAMTLQRDL